PMLPITGTLPGGNPNAIMTPFTNNGEVAQAGYYSAQTNQPNTITSEFTATAHSSMGRFTYPATTQAGFLLKLRNSQNGQFAPSTAQILGSNEVSGSQTSGHFCGEVMNDNQRQEYTVHFDITFDQPFSSSQIIKAANGTPSAVYVTFNTTGNAVVQAKLGISYVSDDNARLNWQTDNAGWNFGNVKSAAQDAWNKLLGRIQVAGGSFAQTQQFYSNLYKAFGARAFDTAGALKAMLAQATTVNDVRPGEALEATYGYLPEDGRYGCCNPHGFVPTLLEYNSQDLALSFFARALGDSADADMLQARANNWQNVFNLSNNLLNGRNQDGSFAPGVTPTSSTRFVEGSAYE